MSIVYRNHQPKSPIIRITQVSLDYTDNQSQEQQQHQQLVTTYDQATCQMSSKVENSPQKQQQAAAAGTTDDLDVSTQQQAANNNLELVKRAEQQSQEASAVAGGSSSNYNKKNSYKETNNNDEEQTHAYKKRFFILALFCAHSAINSFQWIQYSSITNIISDYYSVSNLQVNLTSLVYMITYIPFIIHASLMLERVGLRKAVVLGTLGTALGSLIKWWLGGQPGTSAFWWMMLGQTIVALSQLYIISIPPLLAAVWFPDHQVSTACGVGVFGNQLGIALGFIVPPWVISDLSGKVEADKMNIIGHDLNSLACAVFWISFVICVVSILTLEDKPPKPPGSASLHAAHQHSEETAAAATAAGGNQGAKIEAIASIKELCWDKDFRYLVLSYGINVGCFYAVSTVLNQMVAARWPHLVDLAGRMGLLIVVSGMAGSIMCGQLLDRTHAYKAIIFLIYVFSLVSMILFTIVINLCTVVWPLYFASIILGFFMTGYLPLGFEFAAEITYPHPANTPAGLLNLFAQVFGLILTYSSSLMVDMLGDLIANSFLTVCLGVGLFLTAIMKADLKRQKAVAEEQMKF